jgi:hypothetical protein
VRGVLARGIVAALFVVVVGALSGCGAGPAASAAPPPPPTEAPVPFRLLTHCGIEWAKFEGRIWRAEHPRPAPADVVASDGLIHVDGYTEGTMTRLGPDRVRFDVIAPQVLPGGVEFMATTETPPLCQ